MVAGSAKYKQSTTYKVQRYEIVLSFMVSFFIKFIQFENKESLFI